MSPDAPHLRLSRWPKQGTGLSPESGLNKLGARATTIYLCVQGIERKRRESEEERGVGETGGGGTRTRTASKMTRVLESRSLVFTLKAGEPSGF